MSRLCAICLCAALVACDLSDDDSGDDSDDLSCEGAVLVTLDEVSSTVEGATWEEAGVTLTLLASDGGQFNATHDDGTGCLWLYIGTKLRVEPSCGAGSAEIDVIDYCGGDCAEATAYQGSSELDTASSAAGTDPQTLSLDGGDLAIDAIVVTGLETPVCEIRLDP